MNRSEVLRGILFGAWSLAASLLVAGIAGAGQIAFSMTGEGVLETVPVTAATQSDYQVTGNATLFGNYSGDGRVKLDELTTATHGKFSSALPYIVTAENGDQLCFTYIGEVELVEAGDGLIMTRWVADFKPIVGSGTGVFEQVVGGSFRMTTETDAFAPGMSANVGFRTAGAGSLMMVPEPGALVGILAGGLALCAARRSRRSAG